MCLGLYLVGDPQRGWIAQYCIPSHYTGAAASLLWALSSSPLLFIILDQMPSLYSRKWPMHESGSCWKWDMLWVFSRKDQCEVLNSLVRDFGVCKWVCCSRALLVPPKTVCKSEGILPLKWSVYCLSKAVGAERCISPGTVEERGGDAFTFAVSCLLWSSLQIPAQLGRVKCWRRSPLRAGLLCCHVNCACHLFT